MHVTAILSFCKNSNDTRSRISSIKALIQMLSRRVCGQNFQKKKKRVCGQNHHIKKKWDHWPKSNPRLGPMWPHKLLLLLMVVGVIKGIRKEITFYNFIIYILRIRWCLQTVAYIFMIQLIMDMIHYHPLIFLVYNHRTLHLSTLRR